MKNGSIQKNGKLTNVSHAAVAAAAAARLYSATDLATLNALRAVNGGVTPLGLAQLQPAQPTLLFRTQNGTLINPAQAPFLSAHLAATPTILNSSVAPANQLLNLAALNNQRFIRQPQAHLQQQQQQQQHLANLAALNSSNSNIQQGTNTQASYANVQSPQNSNQTAQNTQSNSQNAAILAAVAASQQRAANLNTAASIALPPGYA